jgi:hypothetical protein
VSTSAPANTNAAISQISATGMLPAYREPGRASGEQLDCEDHVVSECFAVGVGQRVVGRLGRAR